MSLADNFQFLRPDFLWLFLFLPLVFLFNRKTGIVSSAWEKVCDAPILKYLLGDEKKATSKKQSFWFYSAFLFAVIALAGPSWEEKPQPSVKKEMPLMIVLDLSSDMNRTDVRPSRLERAKIEINELLKKTQAAPSGLIVYTYEPFLISPLAEDGAIITNLFKAVFSNIMPVGGNRVDRALEFAASKLKEGGYTQGNILLVSADVPLAFEDAVKEVEKASSQGFKTSVYGVGSKDNEKLETLARKGGGVYTGVQYASSEKLVNFLKAQSATADTEKETTVNVPVDNGWGLCFVVAFCVLWLFRKGVFVLLFAFILMQPAYAGFLFNNDQEGAAFFKAREYEKASSEFENEDWKASAYYKAKNYPAAIEILKNKKDVTSQYNLGNALAKGGKIGEAIEAYERVLEQEPTHEDAKFNLEYLKKLMQNQQQKQNSQNQDKENQNKQNNENQKNQNEDGQQQGSPQQEQQQEQNEDEEKQDDSQNQQQQTGAQDDEKKPDESSDGSNDGQNNLENEKQQQKQQVQAMPAKEQEAEKYDETVQAREQRFREIEDDPGGLLKAFIQREYMKNRYGK